MFGLSVLKRRTAQQMGSETLLAESAMTFLDGCLSMSILAALVLNTTLHWWSADAMAALVVLGSQPPRGFGTGRNRHRIRQASRRPLRVPEAHRRYGWVYEAEVAVDHHETVATIDQAAQRCSRSNRSPGVTAVLSTHEIQEDCRAIAAFIYARTRHSANPPTATGCWHQ